MPATSPNWDSLKTLLADALELAPADREAFLIQFCNGNPDLLAEARALIAAYEQADGVITRRTDAWLGVGGPDLLSLNGQRIGHYQLERLVAEGAMAAVYVARQVNPQRTVAVKLLRSGMLLTDSVSRFRRESQALGRLAHPNIARIYEAGVHREPAPASCSIPYIAMEFVDGPPLTVFAQKHKLGRQQRIELLIKVATAVHAAHQQAIIHRDLKPANVLVDPTGEPKVLDFGVARITETGGDDEYRTWQTTAGVLLGTPGYMSPEQAAGRLDEIDVRTDVWALGVLLHELLTNRLPIDVKNTSVAEAIKRIEQAELQPISRFDKSLKGDLETIVGTALAREKERRYPSAEAMASDLRRVLAYEPIWARPPSSAYRLRKFVRRHRFGAGMTLLILALLVGGAVATSVGFLRARRERDRAQEVNTFLLEMLSMPDPEIGKKDVTVVHAMQAAERLIGKHFQDDPQTEADIRSTFGWTYYHLGLYDDSVAQLRRAVELRQKHSGEGDVRTFDDIARLVTAIRWQYKPADALALVMPAYQRATRVLGEENPTTLALLDNYAGALSDLERRAEAEPLYRRDVELSTKVLGPNDPQTLSAMNNLAVLLINQARWSEAEQVLRQVIQRRSATKDAARATYITNRHNLATVIAAQGRQDEALREFVGTIADARELLGEDHSRTLSLQTSYADALVQAGRAEEALALNRQILEKRRRLLGVGHEQTLLSMHNTINSMLALKKFDEAEPASRELIEAAGKYALPDHVVRIAARQDLAMAVSGLNRPAEAEPLLRGVIADYTRKVGEEHPRVLIQQCNLAAVLMDMDRDAEALTILDAVGAALTKSAYPPLQTAYLRHRGRALTKLKRFDEAAAALSESYELGLNKHNSQACADTAKRFIQLYTSWGRPDDAAKWQARATSFAASTSAPTTAPTPAN